MNPIVTADPPRGTKFMERLRNWLLAGLVVLGPTAITLWVFFRLLNWVDNLLGRYLRFAALDYHRIPGLGLVATLLLLTIVGAFASLIGSRSLARTWDQLLTRIPGVGILYGSTKSLGEALLSSRRQDVFRQVVLIQWPEPGTWRVGFLTGPPSAAVRKLFDEEMEVVFVPHTPNPASGFVHFVPRAKIKFLDWPLEEGLKVVISGGVVQPGPVVDSPARVARVDPPKERALEG